MNMAFHPDGRAVLISNHDEGTIAVVDLECAEISAIPAGWPGVETLSFF
jgi:hypothetical protein